MDTEPVKQVDHVGGEANADGHVADGVFENEVPTDDPGDDFAHGRVGVSVGAARDGNHGSEFGIADRGETASNRDEDEGDGDGGASSRAAERFRMADEVLKKRDVQNGGGLEFLAGDGGANNGRDAGADDRANAEGGQAKIGR